MRFLMPPIYCWVFLAQYAVADVIVLNDATAGPVFGRIVQRDTDTIVFDRIEGDDLLAPTRAEFSTGDVALLIENFDETRLAALRPGELSAYRDYAEELAPQKSDPVARELAMRLFLIVAYWSDRQSEWSDRQSATGQSMKLGALAKLVDLARTKQEAEAFRSLIRLYGGKPNSRSAEQRDELNDNPPDESDEERFMLELVRLLRKGQGSQALQKLNDNSRNAHDWKRWSAIFSWEELEQMAGQKQMTGSELRQLLMVELAIEKGLSVEQLLSVQNNSSGNGRRGWATGAATRLPKVWQLPRLDCVTELDPRKTIYRNGRWVRPENGRQPINEQ